MSVGPAPGDAGAGDPANEVPTVWRRVALAIVLARFAIPLAAIPAIPFLLRDHATWLVLLRPQREFLLLGGGQSRYLGEPPLWELALAFVPLGLLAVPAFLVVGRAYRGTIERGEVSWLARVLPPDKLAIGQRLLERRGPAIALIGRVASLPPTVLAAAAGLSDVDARRYLAADAAGAVLAVGAALGAGYALGRTYERGGAWLTAGGVVLIVALVGLVTHWVRRDAAPTDG